MHIPDNPCRCEVCLRCTQVGLCSGKTCEPSQSDRASSSRRAAGKATNADCRRITRRFTTWQVLTQRIRCRPRGGGFGGRAASPCRKPSETEPSSAQCKATMLAWKRNDVEIRSMSLTRRSTKPSFGWLACPPGLRLLSKTLRHCHQGSTEEEAEDLGTT